MKTINEVNIYKCTACNWKGAEEELDIEKVESCAGDDEVEICPVCGSMNVFCQKE